MLVEYIQDNYHFCYNDDHSNIAIIILITKREREKVSKGA